MKSIQQLKIYLYIHMHEIWPGRSGGVNIVTGDPAKPKFCFFDKSKIILITDKAAILHPNIVTQTYNKNQALFILHFF